MSLKKVDGMIRFRLLFLSFLFVLLGCEAETVSPSPTGDAAAVTALLPGGAAPDNPFTGAAAAIGWDADPGAAGDLGVNPANNTDYIIKGHGKNGLLTLELSNQ